MTPPLSVDTPWGSGRVSCYVPVLPTSFSDSLSSLDLCFEKRPMDPSLDPSYVDVLDLLDAMMTPCPVRLPTGKAKWNGYKASTASGHEIVNWIIDNGFSQSRSQAAEYARQVVKAGGLIPAYKVQSAKKSFNALHTSLYVHRGLTLMADHGLNSCAAFPNTPRPVFTILSELNLAFRQVCHVSVSLDGHFVDYVQIRASAGWRMTLVLLAELAVCDDTGLAKMDSLEKKCCLYNLYNILVFHAKLVFGHPTDLVKRSRFFNSAAYVIAGKRITSLELEHLVLRGKMSHSDPRAHWMLDEKDPRMHFILNCGAQSCPPLIPLELEKTEDALQTATEHFIENNCYIDLPSSRVQLSRLWKWFRRDFTPDLDTDRALLQWIAQRASKDKSLLLNDLLAGDIKLKFAPYNWADNGDVTAKPDNRFMTIYDLSFAKSA